MKIKNNELQRALADVLNELHEVGLYTSRFQEIKIKRSLWVTIFSRACSALYVNWSVIFRSRTILLPYFWKEDFGVMDTIRHEMGHALLYFHPEIRNGWPFGVPPFVTKYAETDADEDFCETLMAYLADWDVRAFIASKFLFLEQIDLNKAGPLEHSLGESGVSSGNTLTTCDEAPLT